MMNQNKGITLVALVVTIIILLILTGITITMLINQGIISKANSATDETEKQIATEEINLKITNKQIDTYAEDNRMPTLQELADYFCEDKEIQYVTTKSQNIGALEKITVGDATSIFTKLKEYPYEFEINDSLQLAGIDGVKIADSSSGSNITEEQINSIIDKKLDEKLTLLENKIYSPTIFKGTVITDTMGGSHSTVDVNEFTVTESGKYVINYVGRLKKWEPGSAIGVYIHENGVAIAGNMYVNNIEYNNAYCNATVIKELTADEKIKVSIYQYGNGNAGVNNLIQNDLQLIKVGN